MRTLAGMQASALSCEVCGGREGLVVRDLEDEPGLYRQVGLCAAHAAEAERRGLVSTRALMDAFREATGRRSLVERRGEMERRQFPPRPEGRRRGPGRRSTDA